MYPVLQRGHARGRGRDRDKCEAHTGAEPEAEAVVFHVAARPTEAIRL